MKRLKRNQEGPFCSFCPPKTNRATHRQNGFAGYFCCVDHKEELKVIEEEVNRKEERLTEADYQTWMRL